MEFMDEIALLRNSYHGRLDFQKNSKGTGGAVNTTQTLKTRTRCSLHRRYPALF